MTNCEKFYALSKIVETSTPNNCRKIFLELAPKQTVSPTAATTEVLHSIDIVSSLHTVRARQRKHANITSQLRADCSEYVQI